VIDLPLLEYCLVPIAFVTSTISAIVGLGGGLFLIAFMPLFLPFSVVVPLHGIVQSASNVSRFAFDAKQLNRQLFYQYLVGTPIGALIGGLLLRHYSFDLMPLILGLTIIYITWAPLPKRFLLFYPFTLLGAVQSFLGLFVGGTGPLSASLLSTTKLSRDEIVITNTAFSIVVHILTVLVFGIIGFVVEPYILLLIGMISASALGSWFGTRIRKNVEERTFRVYLNVTITLLALVLIISFFY